MAPRCLRRPRPLVGDAGFSCVPRGGAPPPGPRGAVARARAGGPSRRSFCLGRQCGQTRGDFGGDAFSKGRGGRRQCSTGVLCSHSQHGKDKQRSKGSASRVADKALVTLTAGGAACALALAVTLNWEELSDWVCGDGVTSGIGTWGLGNGAAAVLWGIALYFCSPLQLLLLFLGKVDTERPSDWLTRRLGQLAPQRVYDADYTAPAALRAATAAAFAGGGAGVAWALQAGLGDTTWGVATGLGACMAAAVYEVGRPPRLSTHEAQVLEAKWRDFVSFADKRLERAGRVHESEVDAAFRREFVKYRRPGALPASFLRDAIRQYHPAAERTPAGYYRKLSLRAHADAFHGKAEDVSPLAAALKPPRIDGQ